MKHLFKDIVKWVIGWFVIDIINKWLGHNMIQTFLIYLWNRFPFEIITFLIMLIGLFCTEYYRIIYLGEKEFEHMWDEYKSNIEKDIKILSDKIDNFEELLKIKVKQ